ncbi:MAG: zinc ribbon domain-containing protein [Clostridia bacterium]|nr:zinc ribbon domain-containing protein [Clostridia bacterium]
MKKALSVVCILLALLLTLISCGESDTDYKDEDDDTVICPYCDEENDAGNKYCNECGKSLQKVIVCPVCKTENTYKNKYCKECGASLQEENSGSSNTGNSNTGSSNSGNSDIGNSNSGNANSSSVILLTESVIYSNGEFYERVEHVYDASGNLTSVNRYHHSSATGKEECGYSLSYMPSGQDNVVKYTKTKYVYSSSVRRYVADSSETLYDVYDGDGRKLYTTPLSPAMLQSMTDIYSSATLSTEEMYKFHVQLGADSCTVSENVLTSGDYVAVYKLYKGDEMIGCEYEYYTSSNQRKVDTLYIYDGKNIVKEYEYDPDVECFLLRYEYKYDKEGNISARTQYCGQNKPGVTTLVYSRDTMHGYHEEVSHDVDIYNDVYTNTYTLLSDYTPPSGTSSGGSSASSSGGQTTGTAKCSLCREAGYSMCQGHTCTVCNGQGSLRCNGCGGTGKKAYSPYPDNACPVCFGAKTQICPNCEGARKIFYTN